MTTTTLTLAEFLEARIVEDEAIARRPGYASGRGLGDWSASSFPNYHLLVTDPARVLAECEAKRRIVELCEPHEGCSGHPGSYMPHGDYGPGLCRRWADDDPIVRLLAEVYADHSDYRDEWKL